MSKSDSLTPEMLKIIKIFGIGSLAFVFLLSFFNEKRANNSGKETSILSITDAERLYFKNVRGLYYDLEGRDDAKMSVYRYGKRVQEADHPLLNLSILINRVKDEAYIYVESSKDLSSFSLRVQSGTQTDTIKFVTGDKIAHFEFVEKLYPLLEENTYFEILIDEDWIPILIDEKERDALRIPIKDFYRLINKPE
ncbi:hypothetical protein Belba_0609 [Belliella baltica DSM 15883]|uniref:Uncharacterized protein n=1 Tax=Belliella baltica (strain DSM 15883 / CIP 108006 / LMG 21964 / BA134) TaxID=866536 RepID=I3Z1Z8_BELBD|nr:hypothetical protein [Belliella baltica]AFL83266.1 hypothetical protein Belba_0609 [Belliella baltica DSM 15883]